MNHMNGGADQKMWFMLGACRRQSHRDFFFFSQYFYFFLQHLQFEHN